jgi:hypothetical protein
VKKMPLEDKATARLVERELSKHSIDASMVHVQVINHICYIGGTVSKLQGQLGRGVDVKQELARIGDAIRLIRGVNDVVIDARVV